MGLFDWLRPAPRLDARTRALIEQAAGAVDPALRRVPGYARTLAPPLRHALDYCADLAGRIPGPYEVSRAAFATDPMVHAVFGSADSIEAMLGRSRCVREHLTDPLAALPGRCCALLGMRRHEKAGFGVRLNGEVLQTDLPQRTLYFSDHTLAEPAADLDHARERLRLAMFDSLLASFSAHLEAARQEHAGLAREHALETAWSRGAGAARPAAGDLPCRRIDALHARLRASADALSPSRLVDSLAACLAQPQAYLELHPVTVRVDRSGILCDADASADGCDTLEFAELVSRDRRRWVVMLARIDRDEARRAVDRCDEARRHIVI